MHLLWCTYCIAGLATSLTQIGKWPMVCVTPQGRRRWGTCTTASPPALSDTLAADMHGQLWRGGQSSSVMILRMQSAWYVEEPQQHNIISIVQSTKSDNDAKSVHCVPGFCREEREWCGCTRLIPLQPHSAAGCGPIWHLAQMCAYRQLLPSWWLKRPQSSTASLASLLLVPSVLNFGIMVSSRGWAEPKWQSMELW